MSNRIKLYCKRREEDRIEFEIDSSGEMFIMIKKHHRR